MKKVVVLSLAVIAMAALPRPASASIIGHFTVANCTPGGGVTVAIGLIDWLTGSPSACLGVGALTNVTGTPSVGTLTSGFSGAGTINDLPGVPGITGFMSFVGGGVNMHFDLAPVGGFGPGSGTSCAVDPGVNNTCSIPGSPFLLTETLSPLGTLGTSVTLVAHGTILDTGDGITSSWEGAFTTQISNLTPAQIQAIELTPGGSITSTFSGEFNVTPLPEPISMALIGGGLIALAALKRRKQV
jgi:hypothetical protein